MIFWLSWTFYLWNHFRHLRILGSRKYLSYSTCSRCESVYLKYIYYRNADVRKTWFSCYQLMSLNSKCISTTRKLRKGVLMQQRLLKKDKDGKCFYYFVKTCEILMFKNKSVLHKKLSSFSDVQSIEIKKNEMP